eukprot:164928_1
MFTCVKKCYEIENAYCGFGTGLNGKVLSDTMCLCKVNGQPAPEDGPCPAPKCGEDCKDCQFYEEAEFGIKSTCFDEEDYGDDDVDTDYDNSDDSDVEPEDTDLEKDTTPKKWTTKQILAASLGGAGLVLLAAVLVAYCLYKGEPLGDDPKKEKVEDR